MKKYIIILFSFVCLGVMGQTRGEEIMQPVAVNLGLSVKWASFNIGATVPEEFGNLYAFAETEEKSSYTLENYSHFIMGNGRLDADGFVIKDRWVELDKDIKWTKYDVAHVKLGGPWRLPTEDEFYELRNGCEWEETTKFGIPGHKITAKNGNWIFIPTHSGCGYWSSESLSERYAVCLSYGDYIDSTDKYRGLYVRPVYAEIPDLDIDISECFYDEEDGASIRLKENDKVYEVVEQQPSFPGGPSKLMEYLAKNINYPATAKENGIQGRVIVCFIVNTDGSIADVNAIRGVDPSLDREAERLVRDMPKWTPGKQNGKPVRVKFNVPVTFKLQ